MSRFAAGFFSYLQGAEFYRELHRKAVALLPPGAGELWFDFGCGPGLVARLAAAHGYRAIGFDINPAMIAQARKHARQELSPSGYEVAGIGQLPGSGRKARVVSAASLLAVLPDKERALQQLLSCLADGGVLLLVETTDLMTPRAAWSWLRRNGWGKRNWILLLWAWVRQNQETVTPMEWHVPGHRIVRADILAGLVAAWLVCRAPGPVMA